jgi:hypothetical protein
MPDDPIDTDLAALSHALGGLTPAAPALNRDRLLYEAGRRAGSPRRGWRLTTVGFAVLAAGLGTRLATLPAPEVQVVYVPGASRERERPEDSRTTIPPVAHAPESPAAVVHSLSAPYLRLRDQVVRFGADSLPAALPAAAGPRPSVEKLLGVPLDDALKSRWQQHLSRGDV